MVARCNLCDELITAENQEQFFPEDDSYICTVCQKEYKTTLENMKNHPHRQSSGVEKIAVE